MRMPDPDTLRRWGNYLKWSYRGFIIFLPLLLATLLFGDRFYLWGMIA